MALTLPDIEQLFAERGGEQYAGEPVTQLQHALQCALQAEHEDALLQGGVFTPTQCEAFLQQPGADDAVRVRVWDDLAKYKELATPPLSHYLERARRCALGR
jgi:predicted HD phosphohydrolase